MPPRSGKSASTSSPTQPRVGPAAAAVQAGLTYREVVELAEYGQLALAVRKANTAEGQQPRRVEARTRE
ncbi:hypothetical protein NJB18091_29440 [Mycobacterium marinum]|nr:hypothetical protein NJB18091_29440 [Mycobacterium marinum]GJO18795.1 hypothetical protein NJB1507_11060 [Mycobacterium marinum]